MSRVGRVTSSDVMGRGFVMLWQSRKRHIIGYFDSDTSPDFKTYHKVAGILRDDCTFHAAIGSVLIDYIDLAVKYSMVTCEMKLFQPSSTSVGNNFNSAHGNLPEIILEALLQLVNIFQHVQCRWNHFQIISELFMSAEIISFQLQMWLYVK